MLWLLRFNPLMKVSFLGEENFFSFKSLKSLSNNGGILMGPFEEEVDVLVVLRV